MEATLWTKYLTEWLEKFRQTNGLTSLRLAGNDLNLTVGEVPGAKITVHEVKYPLKFADKILGELKAESQAEIDVAALESLAGSVAAFLRFPQRELAVEWDRRISELKEKNPIYDWCGIYTREGNDLFVSVYRGAPTPHAIIALNSGICGAAITENQTLNIPDVTQDPRYLSCDLRAKSEIVIPIRDENGNAVAELDIDSHTANAFTQERSAKLEVLTKELQDCWLNANRSGK